MANENGLRIGVRIERDIIPFLIRNYLWDKNKNEPTKAMLTLKWIEKIEDIIEREVVKGEVKKYHYWHFTEKGKEGICKLINNIY